MKIIPELLAVNTRRPRPAPPPPAASIPRAQGPADPKELWSGHRTNTSEFGHNDRDRVNVDSKRTMAGPCLRVTLPRHVLALQPGLVLRRRQLALRRRHPPLPRRIRRLVRGSMRASTRTDIEHDRRAEGEAIQCQ